MSHQGMQGLAKRDCDAKSLRRLLCTPATVSKGLLCMTAHPAKQLSSRAAVNLNARPQPVRHYSVLHYWKNYKAFETGEAGLLLAGIDAAEKRAGRKAL